MSYYVIAVGGTGMRCLEAFTHLCAMGMLGNKEIEVLTIDTDTANGNKSQTEELINRYNDIKKANGRNRPTSDTFFSAKLNLYRFSPQYKANTNLKVLAEIDAGTSEERQDNQDLADLFFESKVQEFNLGHGYRAQTHLGSLLMYHSILEAGKRHHTGNEGEADKSLNQFLARLASATENNEEKKVFVFGSVFGGTGASAIPVLPSALKKSWEISTPNQTITARFACSLLTSYFEFKAPTQEQLQKEKIVADSANFAHNSQAALKYYINDDTVKSEYDVMMHVGWDFRPKNVTKSNDQITVTGGHAQRNQAHPVEMLCAFAALEYFQRKSGFGAENRASIQYRVVNVEKEQLNLDFGDFAGRDLEVEFARRCASFYSLAMVLNELKTPTASGVENFAAELARHGLGDYLGISRPDGQALQIYMESFAYGVDSEGGISPGWMKQMADSSGVNEFLLNRNEAYAFNTVREVTGRNYGKLLVDEKHQFAKGGFLRSPRPYDEIREVIQKNSNCKPNSTQSVEGPLEVFLAHYSNALRHLYKFS